MIDWGSLMDRASESAVGLDLVIAYLEPFENLLDNVWLEQDPGGEWIVGTRIQVPDDCLLFMEDGFPGRYWVARIWPQGSVELEEFQDDGGMPAFFVGSTSVTRYALWEFLRQWPAGDLNAFCGQLRIRKGV